MKKIKVTKAHEKILREQVIDLDRPDAVLRDFRTVLDFVGLEGVKAAGKYNLLPIDAIAELDTRLSRPLLLNLKCPELRSHPYLWGLQLLLRASGLSHVEGSGAKTRLLLDPSMHAEWDHLNLTEQYFTLLEAWLRIGRTKWLADRGTGGSTICRCRACKPGNSFRPRVSAYDVENPQYVYVLSIGREFYQLALMELFGLVEVEQPPPKVTPWCPAAVRHAPFGDALLTLLADRVLSSPRALFAEEVSPQPPRFGEWQPIFQPYFPDWRGNLNVPEIEPREGIFVFRVSIGKVWRRIALRAEDSVDALVSWILKSVHFGSDHLYELLCRDRFGRTMRILHPYMGEQGQGPSGDEVSVNELPLLPGQSMTLVYDFGDNWQFDVKLEAIEPLEAKIKAPCILEKHGQAPEQYPRWDD